MKKIFDASALFNLVNGGVLDTVTELLTPTACLGPLVKKECLSIAAVLDAVIASGRLEVIDDSTLPSSVFFRLLQDYQLGDGETECLAFASTRPLLVCCDDRRARNMITKELGDGRVIGTLGLLLRAVELQKLTPEQAWAAYEQMRRRGGFLPDVKSEVFSKP